MSVKLKALQAVAGTTAANAAGGATNVEDVFSTYLYEGNADNGKSQGINNDIALGNFGVGSSTHFDGVTEYPIERSGSALTGTSSGSKTFTYSGWIQLNKNPITSWSTISFNGFFFNIYGNENQLLFIGRNSSSTNIFYGEVNGANPRLFNNGEWFHILISADLTNASNRHVYINDVSQTVTWNTYTNDTIAFGQTTVTIGNRSTGGYNFDHNQAHLYLDFTYRDLSTTSNRRIFIDADGGSTSASSLAALNPIIYLPMTSGYEIGVNQGTGGDFTNNGGTTIDTNLGTEYDSDAGQGGAVIFKSRTTTEDMHIYDTARGANNRLSINQQTAQYNGASTYGLKSFNATGFAVGATGAVNGNGIDLASWTFRKAPKFFDIVTYSGDTNSQQVISHALDSEPGMVVIKSTNTGGTSWWTWHRGLGANTASSGKQFALDSTSPVRNTGTIYTGSAFNWTVTSGAYEQGSYLQGTSSTDITVGYEANQNGWEYVAYIFGHNDGDGVFGPDEDQDIIYCGTYTGGNGTRVDVELGWEPQWIIAKNIDQSGFSAIADNMRGIETVASGNNTRELRTTANNAESYNEGVILRPTGFTLFSNQNQWNSNANYVYMAIRRGPMATPTNTNEVFAIDNEDVGSSNNPPLYVSNFPVDFALRKQDNNTANWAAASRLTGINYMSTNLPSGESTVASYEFDYMNGWSSDAGWNAAIWSWMWRRAPGFFDVVTYTGDGVQGRDISHNLKVVPEMMWVKRRDTNGDWAVYHSGVGNTASLRLDDTRNTTGAVTSSWWNNTSPTDSVFTVGSASDVNTSTGLFIAYLFASLDGISKVGSYTGDGTSGRIIDCGFSNGARFVLAKSYTHADNWWLFDSERGIVAGNDARLWINDSAAEVTNADTIDSHSSGFIVNNTNGELNDTGRSYIFYAIA